MDTGFIDKDKIESDNYLDYLSNTQSESDYNSFYITKFDLLMLILTKNT